MTTLLDLVARIVRVLDQIGIPYHVGGSIASAWYGQPRATADVDIVIEADAPRLEALARELRRDFFMSRAAMAEALASRGTFNAVALDSPFKIDFFLVGARAFDREEFRRAVEHALDSRGTLRVRLKSPEDMVLRKLEWFRLGGDVSDQQWRDVLGILVAMRDRLDETYLERWAAALGLSDLLARAREETAGL